METKRITSSDLMIGDWVLNTFLDKPMKVEEICRDMIILEEQDRYKKTGFEPIPITEEILEKNGFKYHPNIDEDGEEEPRYALFFPMRDGRTGEDCIVLSARGEYNEDFQWGLDVQICGHTYIHHELNYVHELQHLMRFAMVKKEIEL